ncbi:spore coat protein [Peribacillus cavernae]|uniref:Spore coat protein n=1 Tax=Peribacillus cavernae TaxID=1674310 RepID=A0A433HKD9_9BACI|nr:spore coat protein [Peribacillus cavernae]MDQ0219090.1 spore coat protein CotF [Peribacillus cavernae]RUQ28675.1 spore coat protein [Peribacillus cavernae]
MINDYLEVENAEGMPEMADSALALEFLLSIKTGVRNAAYAITEARTPEVRNTFRKQMDAGLTLHEEVANFMMEKEWMHPYNVNDQYKVDMKSAEAVLMIGNLNLFPGDTSRMGMMAQIDSDE